MICNHNCLAIGNMVCWKESVFEVLEEKDVVLSKEVGTAFTVRHLSCLKVSSC